MGSATPWYHTLLGVALLVLAALLLTSLFARGVVLLKPWVERLLRWAFLPEAPPPIPSAQPSSEKPPGPALVWVARGQEGTLSYAADVGGALARLGRNASWAPSMWLLVHGVQVWHLRGETPAQAQAAAEAVLLREPLCLYACPQAPGVQ